MTPAENKDLRLKAVQVREGVLTSTHGAKAGHPGGSLSSADMFTYLYCKELRIDPKNPKDPNRDRFVLSKGHTTPGLYSALALRGFFPVDDLPTFRHIDSYLQGHPNMNTVPGVDMSTGSLGQGISAAVGMARKARKSRAKILKFIRWWATANWRKVRSGKRPCSPRIINWIICALSSI